MKKIVPVFLFLLLSEYSANAQFPAIISYHQDANSHERNRNIDVSHMYLDVYFDAPKKKVFGKVTHTFTSLHAATDTIFFDGPGIQIVKASLDGKPLAYFSNHDGVVCVTKLKNDYKKTHAITFEYTANPLKGIYFIGWNLGKIDDPVHMSRRQIWTQGQGTDNRYWIPMIDDRADKYITEVLVRFDKEYNVLSNGALKSKTTNPDGSIGWHYLMPKPHSGYLLMLAIDKYAVKSSVTKRGTPIHFWYYPEHPSHVGPTSIYSEKIIEFLEDETGIPYAWGSYSQVMIQDFLYGAMENTSATTFGDFFSVDSRSFLDRNYITVNAHEATHQWFGDLITGRHDAEQWLQESFATFYPGLFLGSIYGNDEQTWYYRGQMNGAIAAGKLNSLPVRNSAAGSSRHYPKGASVLHMLRHVLGEENYRHSIKLYLERHAFGTVETWDLQKAIIDATGINMDGFFDQWIHRGGEPQYKVSWQMFDVLTNPMVEMSIEQVQLQDPVVGLFKMPIDIAVCYSDGSIDRKTVLVDKLQQKIRMPILRNSDITVETNQYKSVVCVLFDEGSHILKQVYFEKSDAELQWQLANAPTMIDRYDALIALKNRGLGTAWKNDLLTHVFAKESFREMKAEVASQQLDAALKIGIDSAAKLGTRLYENSFVEVRKTVLEKLPAGSTTRDLFLRALSDSSYGNIELVLNKIWMVSDFEASHNVILDKIKDLDGYLNNIKIKYLELASETYNTHGGMENDRAQYVGALVRMTGPYYEFRTRINAMNALKRLNYLDGSLSENLYDCVLGFNGRLAQPATELIQYFKQQTAQKKILQVSLSKLVYTNQFSTEQLKKLDAIIQ